jgi:two-component system response regulator YesN
MYKTLIIDDEQPARRAIRALGQWEQHRISEVYEAENGMQGLELLTRHEPDLIFVDMKMPHLGGVEFMKKAESFPGAKFIVISGFDDFCYTRSAVQSGAVDYLLKPIKRKELNDAIAKAVDQLDRERLRKERELAGKIVRNISLPLVKEKIFSSIIDHNGRLHRMEELAGFVDAKPGDRFSVIVITVLNIAEVCRLKFNGDSHACYYALTNALNELLGSLGEAFSFKSGKDEQELVVVLSSSGAAGSEAEQQGIGHALTQLKETFGFDCIAAFEANPRSMEHLDVSYQSARAMLLRADLLRPQPVHCREADPVLPPDSILTKKELVLHALDTGSSVVAVGILRQYFQELRHTGRFTAEAMARTVAEFRVLLEHILKSLSVSALERFDDFDARFRHPLMRFDRFEELTVSFFETVFQELLELRKPEEKFNIDKVKAYIDRHFYEDISISLLMEKFYLSKEHLHRLFKQKFGCGIHEYTLKLRMEKAKELLADSGLKIQTICEKVGFHDHNYFSKAFKKQCGLSPQEYRTQLAASGAPETVRRA